MAKNDQAPQGAQGNAEVTANEQTIFIVAVGNFNGSKDRPAKEDANGLMPVVLSSIDGEVLPERSSVMSGTIAHNAGLIPGESVMVSIKVNANNPTSTYKDANGADATGINYNYQVLKTLSFKDLRDIQAEQSTAKSGVAQRRGVTNPF